MQRPPCLQFRGAAMSYRHYYQYNQAPAFRGRTFSNYHRPPPRQHFQRPLDYRDWDYAKLLPPPNYERFTVLSYNILAEYLATNHRGKLYYHVPRYILDWQWRKRSIAFELRLWSAHILCFQEVDRFQDLEEMLNPLGYTGIWKMRTGDPIDGCAIFWRTSRFKLLYEESIEFSKYGLRDNVAQICVLESTSCNRNPNESTSTTSPRHYKKIVVCNIHVLFNPKRGDIKLGQVRELLHRADAVSKLWDEAPVILCGDFNSTPKSPLYNFMEKQKLDLSEVPRHRVSGQASTDIAPQIPSNDHGNNLLEVAEGGSIQSEDKWEELSPAILPQVSFPEKLERSLPNVVVHEVHGEGGSLDGAYGLQDGSSNAAKFHGVQIDLGEVNDILDNTPVENMEDNGLEKFMYNSSAWTSEEMRTATGNADCKVVEHPMKLKSSYTEVEDISRTRDSSGEPLVTSYHRRFQGTVDYIWRSEGLQTVRVLAPISKSAMEMTPGFPTKKWGSDHIALVSELAFTKDYSDQNIEVQ